MNSPFPSPPAVDPRIYELLQDVKSPRKAGLLADMITTILGLGQDDAEVLDLKLFRRALKEMRYASSVFHPYREIRKVAVFGSARTQPDAPEYHLAREFAEKMTAEGFMILTGGGDGIMGAAQHGAGAEKSFGLNIRLPFEQKANETIQGDPKLINFHYFFTRKLHFMKETHALVLLPGGFGTQDEGFESLTLMQTGKTQLVPVILLDKVNGHYWETWRRFLDNDLLESGLISPSDFNLFRISHSADEAVQEIKKFYRHFHSYRWVRDQMVIRLQRPLSAAALETLVQKFSTLIGPQGLLQSGPLPEEKDDTHLLDKPRLIFTPLKKDFGLLRLLINQINESQNESK